MLNKNIAYYQLRLNLDDEKQNRIFHDIEEFNKKLWKSKNNYIIEALNYYGQEYGGTRQKEEERREREKQRAQELQFKEEMIKEVTEVVNNGMASMIDIILKAAFHGGGNITVTNQGNEPDDRKSTDSEYEQKAIDLLDKWNNWEEDKN